MRKFLSAILLSLTVSTPAICAEADTVGIMPPAIMGRVVAHDDLLPGLTPQPFANPAIKQWMRDYSYSTIAADYRYDGGNEAIDVQRGKGEGTWGFTADSYLKYKSSTLWGEASYRNGRQRGVNWNESSDIDIIYPYVVADSIGGDMHVETYSFAGGYADHTDRWAWGVTLGYDAGLYYRDVDPRPRNTTGCLDISAGGAMRIAQSAYRAGVSVNFRKYKQSGDVEFVNELSDSRIWHLTGLGTHYERFAGNGYSHYYNGCRWGGSIDLFPQTRSGAVASVGYSTFSFKHILSGLNKLPLQEATDNRIDAMAGWLAPGETADRAVTVALSHSKRTGKENIFGDATGNVYPQIGSLALYSHTLTTVNANFLWQWRGIEETQIAVLPAVEWSRSLESYVDPRRRLLLSSFTPSVKLQGSHRMGALWHGTLTVDYGCTIPAENSCELPYNGSISTGMQQVDIHRYGILSEAHQQWGVLAEATRAVSDRYALSVSAGYGRRSYTAGVHYDNLIVSLSLIF